MGSQLAHKINGDHIGTPERERTMASSRKDYASNRSSAPPARYSRIHRRTTLRCRSMVKVQNRGVIVMLRIVGKDVNHVEFSRGLTEWRRHCHQVQDIALEQVRLWDKPWSCGEVAILSN